jgi:hypothetical protein
LIPDSSENVTSTPSMLMTKLEALITEGVVPVAAMSVFLSGYLTLINDRISPEAVNLYDSGLFLE